MASNKVSIPRKDLECLREHLDQAYEILRSLGLEPGGESPLTKPETKKVTFKQGVDNYKKLLESGRKRTLPAHLRKR